MTSFSDLFGSMARRPRQSMKRSRRKSRRRISRSGERRLSRAIEKLSADPPDWRPDHVVPEDLY